MHFIDFIVSVIASMFLKQKSQMVVFWKMQLLSGPCCHTLPHWVFSCLLHLEGKNAPLGGIWMQKM